MRSVSTLPTHYRLLIFHAWQTDQLLVLADSLAAVKEVQPTDFATRLHQWSTQGLPNARAQPWHRRICAFNTAAARRLPASISDQVLDKVLKAENYVSSPAATAKQAWESEGKIATCSGLVRSALLGAVDIFDTQRIVTNARRICLVRLTLNPHLWRDGNLLIYFSAVVTLYRRHMLTLVALLRVS